MQSFAGSSRWLAVTLSSDALIKSISSGAGKFIGYAPEELLDQPITKILADDSAFEVPHILDAAGKWGHWEGGIVHQNRAGEPVEARGGVSLLASNGNPAGGYLLISNFDISPSPNPGGDSTLAEVSAYLRTIAHDLNNPLAVMMGFTQLLTLNATCPTKIRADIERVYAEMKRVIEIVERLHGYAISLEEKSQRDPSAAGNREPCTSKEPAVSFSASGSLSDH